MNSSNLAVVKETPEGLAYHIALNRTSATGNTLWTEDEIAADHGITTEELQEFKKQPEFQKEVLVCMKDLKENGRTVQLKARHLFEHYMETWIPTMFADDEVPAAEKNKALMFLGKTSGFGEVSQQATESAKQAQNTVPTIHITLTQPASQGQIIDVN